MLAASRPAATAATLGADLRAGKIDACDLIEETLAAIAAYPDEAIFTEVTRGARRTTRGVGRQHPPEGRKAVGPTRWRPMRLEGSVRR